LPHIGELRTEVAQPLQVQGAEALQARERVWGELDMYAAVVFRVPLAPNQTRLLGPVDQADDAVVAQQQRISQLGERRPSGVGVRADDKRKLDLRWRHPMLARLFLGPRQVPTNARS
jgi:hypothetical protein